MATAETFGALLRRHRRAAGLTQTALAERASLSRDGISALERGINRSPRQDTLHLLTDALHLSATERAAFEAAVRRQPTDTAADAAPRADPGKIAQLPPLVGRARELALLQGHLTPQGSPLLLLAGEPGIGKSRLLREAAGQAASQGWTVLAGSCHKRSGQDPYAPVLQALERYSAQRSVGQRRRDLQGCAWLVRLLPELDGAAPGLADRMIPPEQERRLMFTAVGRFLANVAGPAGTLLVLDDLHWAGGDALDLLAALVRLAPANPLRLIGAYRSTEVRSHDPLLNLATELIQIGRAARADLGPLSVDEAEVLLDALLEPVDGVTGHLARRVLERAEGVPLYLVSCAHALRVGAVNSEDSSSDKAGSVPWDLAQSIRQRVAVLSEAAQEVLGVAAVVGREVDDALLAATSSGDEERVASALESVCRARLLLETGDRGYRFAHEIVREVVEAELGTRRRRLLHRRVAEALEHLSGDPPIDELAHHFLEAGEIERALPYLEQAGDRARAVYANTQAESIYRRLVTHCDRLAWPLQGARAREKLGAVLSALARDDEALEVLEQALAAYRNHSDAEGMRRAAAAAGRAHARRGTPKQDLVDLRSLLPELSAAASAGGVALHAAVAELAYASGQYAAQLAAAERAAEGARAAHDDRLLAQVEMRRGNALLSLGRMEEGAAVVAGAIALAERSGDLWTFAHALHIEPAVHESQGEFEQELRYVERAYAIAERLAEPRALAWMMHRRGMAAYFLADWDRARHDYERAISLIGQVDAAWILAYPLLGLGLVAMGRGERTTTEEALGRVIELGEMSGDVQILRWGHLALAERELLEGHPDVAQRRLLPLLDRAEAEEAVVTGMLPFLAWTHLAQDDGAQARDILGICLARAISQNMRPAAMYALWVQAMLALREENWQEAKVALDAALSLCRAMRYRHAEAKVLLCYGQLHSRRGAAPLARDQLEQALAILRPMGERLYAERAEQALAQLERP